MYRNQALMIAEFYKVVEHIFHTELFLVAIILLDFILTVQCCSFLRAALKQFPCICSGLLYIDNMTVSLVYIIELLFYT